MVFVSLCALSACASNSGGSKPWVMPVSVTSGSTVEMAYPANKGSSLSREAPAPLVISPEIQTLLTEALQHNPAIKIAQSRQSEAIANKNTIDAGLMPKVEVGARTNRTRSGNEDNSDPARTSHSTKGSVDLTIPIDLFGKRAATSEAVAYLVDQTTAQLEDTRLGVMQDVAIAAFDAAEQSLLQALNSRQLETNRTSEKLTKLRYTKGQADIVDVLQQKDLVASLEQETPALIAGRQNALDTLSLLMSKLPGSIEAEAFLDLPEVAAANTLVSPQGLLTSRPDLRALKAGLDAADSRLAAAIKDRLPSLDFSSSAVATLASGDIASVISGTLSAAFTLFDGGAKKAIVRAERAALAEKGAIYIEAWLRAVVEVDGLLAEEKRRVTEYGLAVARLDNARKLHTAAERRYRLGASDYLPVLSAKRTIEQQERSLLSLRASLMRARVRLHTAMGGEIATGDAELPSSNINQTNTTATEI